MSAVLFAGCDSGPSGGDSDAPPVFSANVFLLDTEVFEGVGGKNRETGLNFIAAAIRVAPVSVILAAHTIIPSTIAQSAVQATPTLESGVWTWSRSIPAGDETFDFSLTAQVEPSQTTWKMFISSSGPYLGETYSNFQLFSGQTTNNGKTGSWELFYLIGGERTMVLEGSYNIPDDDTRQVSFRIPLTAQESAGDSVLYQADGLTRIFFWTQVQSGLEHEVRWNVHTEEGSILANNYRDGQLSCWDGFFDDAACVTF